MGVSVLLIFSPIIQRNVSPLPKNNFSSEVCDSISSYCWVFTTSIIPFLFSHHCWHLFILHFSYSLIPTCKFATRPPISQTHSISYKSSPSHYHHILLTSVLQENLQKKDFLHFSAKIELLQTKVLLHCFTKTTQVSSEVEHYQTTKNISALHTLNAQENVTGMFTDHFWSHCITQLQSETAVFWFQLYLIYHLFSTSLLDFSPVADSWMSSFLAQS